MRRAPRTIKAMQRGGFSNTDGSLPESDPTDPTPKGRGLARLPALAPLPRAKPARRAQRAVKTAKRRASSRRR